MLIKMVHTFRFSFKHSSWLDEGDGGGLESVLRVLDSHGAVVRLSSTDDYRASEIKKSATGIVPWLHASDRFR